MAFGQWSRIQEGARHADEQKTNHRLINYEHPGESVDIKAHLVAGKINLFDFYSEYCPPCRQIAPYLEKLAAKRSDLVINKVDINRKGTSGIDWGSPLAKQYGLRSIPAFKIFDGKGALVAEGDDAKKQVIGWINDAGL